LKCSTSGCTVNFFVDLINFDGTKLAANEKSICDGRIL